LEVSTQKTGGKIKRAYLDKISPLFIFGDLVPALYLQQFSA
jgi:hypothetical protein